MQKNKNYILFMIVFISLFIISLLSYLQLSSIFFDKIVMLHNLFRFVKLCLYSAVFPAIILLFLLNRRARGFLTCFVPALIFFFTLFHLIFKNYLAYFGDILQVKKLNDIGYLADIKYQLLYQIINWDDILTICLCVLAGICALKILRYRRDMPRRKMIRLFSWSTIIVYVLFFILQNFRYGIPANSLLKFGDTMTAYFYGTVPTYAALVSNSLAAEQGPRMVPDHPGSVNEQLTTQQMPNLDVPNVFVLQVESLDTKAIKYKAGDEYVMPFLNALIKRSAWFENFYAQHNGGGSSDSELAAFFSLIPITSHSGFKTANYDRIDHLIDFMKQHGYHTTVFHPNRGSFFSRSIAYANMEADAFFDEKFYTGEAKGWYGKDAPFYEQSFDIHAQYSPPKPLFYYFITNQSHGPFRNYNDQTKQALNFEDEGITSLEKNYLYTMREVDDGVKMFYELLRKHGLDQNTLVIIYADHASGVMTKPRGKTENIPLVIYHPKIQPQTYEQAGSHLDIAPTIAHLLKLEKEKTWIGDTLFQQGDRQVVLINRVTLKSKDGEIVEKLDPDLAFDYIQYSEALQNKVK
jgi:lipoteichoic acid synthase